MQPPEAHRNEQQGSFEEQFARREKINVLGGTIEVVDVSPDDAVGKPPILFAPGWGGTPEMYRSTIESLFAEHRRVLSLSHMSKNAAVEGVEGDARERFPEEELRKALSLLAILAEKGVEAVDVIAHSEGAINAVIAASLEPERFRNIVFVNPGGLVGADKLPNLAGRFAMSAISDALTARGLVGVARNFRITSEVARSFAANPLKSFQEGVAISRSEIHDTMRELHDKGIGVAVVAGVDDPVFPMERMQKIVKGEQLDGFISVKGGHNEIVRNPEQFAVAAEGLLSSLAKKRKPNTNEQKAES